MSEATSLLQCIKHKIQFFNIVHWTEDRNQTAVTHFQKAAQRWWLHCLFQSTGGCRRSTWRWYARKRIPVCLCLEIPTHKHFTSKLITRLACDFKSQHTNSETLQIKVNHMSCLCLEIHRVKHYTSKWITCLACALKSQHTNRETLHIKVNHMCCICLQCPIHKCYTPHCNHIHLPVPSNSVTHLNVITI